MPASGATPAPGRTDWQSVLRNARAAPDQPGKEALMSRSWQTALGCTVVLALILGPVAVAVHEQKQMREFRVVREGVLYRSGQLGVPALRRVFHDHGIRTVITLRDKAVSNSPQIDAAEEEFCYKEEVNYIRFPLRNWEAPDGSAPVEDNVRQFREIMSDPANYPVLIHCQAGIHRTGAYCAIFRMEFDHWSHADALAEMKACGYANLDNEWDVLGYLERYRPTWKDREGAPAGPVSSHRAGQVKRW
jgi:protein tyrosine/serine phosphatase